jgi:hypothetical protein
MPQYTVFHTTSANGKPIFTILEHPARTVTSLLETADEDAFIVGIEESDRHPRREVAINTNHIVKIYGEGHAR